MAKKVEKIEEKFDFDSWLDSLKDFKLPSYNELPTIELYMDQVLTYVTSKLEPLIDDNSFLTASMINNYVKGKVIKAPTAKKYNQDIMAQLFFITLVKQVLSIAEIKDILEKNIIEHYDQLVDFESQILSKTINDVKSQIDPNERKKSMYKVALKLAIESEIKKIMVSKIIESIEE